MLSAGSRQSRHRRISAFQAIQARPAFVLCFRCPGEHRPEKETVQCKFWCQSKDVLTVCVSFLMPRVEPRAFTCQANALPLSHATSPGRGFVSRHITAGSFSHTDSRSTPLPLRDPHTPRMKIQNSCLNALVQSESQSFHPITRIFAT